MVSTNTFSFVNETPYIALPPAKELEAVKPTIKLFHGDVLRFGGGRKEAERCDQFILRVEAPHLVRTPTEDDTKTEDDMEKTAMQDRFLCSRSMFEGGMDGEFTLLCDIVDSVQLPISIFKLENTKPFEEDPSFTDEANIIKNTLLDTFSPESFPGDNIQVGTHAEGFGRRGHHLCCFC